MDKNKVITVLGILVGLLTITLIVIEIRGKGENQDSRAGTSGEINGKTNVTEKGNSEKSGQTQTVTNTNESNKAVAARKQAQGSSTVSESAENDGTEVEKLRRFNEKRLSKKSRRHGKERRRVTERAVANLPKKDCVRVFENTFVVEGGCEWSKLLRKNECTFIFDAVLIAKSEIEDAKILPGGEIRIEELRTIESAREKLIITDASLKIDLTSSPIDQIDRIAKTTVSLTATVAGALTPIPAVGQVGGAIAGGLSAAAGAVCAAVEFVRKFDGFDISPLIGKENMKRLYQSFVDGKIKSVKTLLRGMEGKSYRVIYTQEPAPSKKYMQVAWGHKDGTPLTAEEDFILSKANIFIDADMLPDSDGEPPVGKEWEVSAEEVASMFCYDDKMTCQGCVKVSRKANRPNGDWYLEVGRNQKIAVRNVEDRTTGSVLIKEGDATLAPNSPHQTKTLQIVSSGNIMEFSSQTLLWFLSYDTKRGADCQFKGVLRTYIEE